MQYKFSNGTLSKVSDKKEFDKNYYNMCYDTSMKSTNDVYLVLFNRNEKKIVSKQNIMEYEFILQIYLGENLRVYIGFNTFVDKMKFFKDNWHAQFLMFIELQKIEEDLNSANL